MITLEQKWRLVESAYWLIPTLTPLLLLFAFRRILSWRWLGCVAIVGPWLLWLTFTFQLYYPIGFAYYNQRGENPMVRFDDHSDWMPWLILMSALISASVVALTGVVAVLWQRFRSCHTSSLGKVGDF